VGYLRVGGKIKFTNHRKKQDVREGGLDPGIGSSGGFLRS
jgi:hypothetical protein